MHALHLLTQRATAASSKELVVQSSGAAYSGPESGDDEFPGLCENASIIKTPYGWVSARVTDRILELRWMSLQVDRSASLLESQNALPVLRIVFPAPLVHSVAGFFTAAQSQDDEDAITVYLLCRPNLLFALHFPGPYFFYSDELEQDTDWYEESVLSTLGNVDILSWAAPIQTSGGIHGLIASCSDGSLLKLEHDFQQGKWHETPLRASSIISSLRSYLPSFSQNTPSSNLTSSQTISSTYLSSLDLLFTFSRDRKLQVWDMASSNCIDSIDTPLVMVSTPASKALAQQSESESPRKRRQQQPSNLLPPHAAAHISAFYSASEETDYPAYIVLYVPALSSSSNGFFVVYGIDIKQKSSGNTYSSLCELFLRTYDHPTSRLADLSVISTPTSFTLYTLWDEGSTSIVRTIELRELLPGYDREMRERSPSTEYDEDLDLVVARVPKKSRSAEWSSLSLPAVVHPLDTSATFFDSLLDRHSAASEVDIQQIFLKFLLLPGRYSLASLQHALASYLDYLQVEYTPYDVHISTYQAMEEKISLYINSILTPAVSEETGALLFEQNMAECKKEWLRFVSMAEEYRRAENIPLALYADEHAACVISKGRIGFNVPTNSATASYTPEQRALSDLAQQLCDLMPLNAQDELEAAIVETLAAPLPQSHTDVVVEIYNDIVEAIITDVQADEISARLSDLCGEINFEQCLLALLHSLSSFTPSFHQTEQTPSHLATALLSSSATDLITARKSTILALLLLQIFIHGESAAVFASPSTSTSTLVHSLSLYQGYSALSHLASQQAPTNSSLTSKSRPAVENGLSTLFDGLKMSSSSHALFQSSESEESEIEPPYSLLEAIIRHPSYLPNGSSDVGEIQRAVESLVASFGAISKQPQPIEASVEFSCLVSRLVDVGGANQALELAARYPQDPLLSFAKARAELALGQTDDAVTSFKEAASAVYDAERPHDLKLLLPHIQITSAFDYYRFVITLFESTSSDAAIIEIGKYAIASLEDEDDIMVDATAVKEIWYKVFKAACSLQDYDVAYETLTTTPFNEIQPDCLRHFVSVLCENNQVDRLLRYPFAALRQELEKTLSFRARNASDPLGFPNYSQILYSYHISRSDYQNAAAAMAYQARKVGDISKKSGDHSELALFECQCYLAALNALSMVNERKAWISTPATLDAQGRKIRKRRKVDYDVPAELLTSELDIVVIDDLRRDYTLALARLQLTQHFPELARTNFALDATDAVALFTQTANFKAAFSTAATLGVDMTALFENIATKCVNLNRQQSSNITGDELDTLWVALDERANTWNGTLASRAWKLLESYLSRHTDTPKYYQIVLEQILKEDRSTRLPNWLITHFQKQDPAFLLRRLHKYDLLEQAFTIACSMIDQSTTDLRKSTTRHSLSSCLPISVIDMLLQVDIEQEADIRKGRLEKLKEVLQSKIDNRLEVVQKVQRKLLGN